MNEAAIIACDDVQIRDMIYTVRGKQVMLDSDLAELYKVETRTLNQAVTRNPGRFPERFCLKLTSEESEILKS
ncbi:ORF6N domain-containing protein [Olsenella uli]|nr:ORF6N domain-containing protein [Olsenella uli]